MEKIEKKILVVDDEKEVLSSLKNILTNAGYKVVTTTSGKEAVALARSEKPHLIILDIIIPDMMGGEVAQVLSGDAATDTIPIIFLTGLNTKEDEKIVKKAGNYHLLAKPITREDLLEAISRVLSERDLLETKD